MQAYNPIEISALKHACYLYGMYERAKEYADTYNDGGWDSEGYRSARDNELYWGRALKQELEELCLVGYESAVINHYFPSEVLPPALKMDPYEEHMWDEYVSGAYDDPYYYWEDQDDYGAWHGAVDHKGNPPHKFLATSKAVLRKHGGSLGCLYDSDKWEMGRKEPCPSRCWKDQSTRRHQHYRLGR